MKLLLPACAAFLTQVATLHAQSPTPSVPYDWSNVAMGGAGFLADAPVARMFRDAKLMEIGAGTSEIRRMLIGREMMAAMV